MLVPMHCRIASDVGLAGLAVLAHVYSSGSVFQNTFLDHDDVMRI